MGMRGDVWPGHSGAAPSPAKLFSPQRHQGEGGVSQDVLSGPPTCTGASQVLKKMQNPLPHSRSESEFWGVELEGQKKKKKH